MDGPDRFARHLHAVRDRGDRLAAGGSVRLRQERHQDGCDRGGCPAGDGRAAARVGEWGVGVWLMLRLGGMMVWICRVEGTAGMVFVGVERACG